MKIILLKELAKIGRPFEVVDVKDGYARNYLIPKKIAIAATEGNLKGLKKNQIRFSKRKEGIRKESLGIVERLNSLTLKTKIRVGIDGKAFGAITSSDLVDLLKSEGLEIDKKNIVTQEPIKHPGIYDIKVHLPEKITAVFKLVVLEEGG